MRRLVRSVRARRRGHARGEARGWRRRSTGILSTLIPLITNSTTSVVAGITLSSMTDAFHSVPGLLVIVPAAIGLRGNVFGALGSRLSTSIHTGDFKLTFRSGSVLGDNLVAATLVTILGSVAVAIIGVAAAVVLGLGESLDPMRILVVSVVGGVVASSVVIVITVVLAERSVRYGWDLDNIAGPVVSTFGDVITLPSLWLAAALTGHRVSKIVAALATVVCVSWAVWSLVRTRRVRVLSIVRESLPVLTFAALVSTMAGVILEARLAALADAPALLVLVPSFVSSSGALGTVLAARVATSIHLGLVDVRPWPPVRVWRDVGRLGALALVVFSWNGVLSVGAAMAVYGSGAGDPGVIGSAVFGGYLLFGFVVAIAWLSSIASARMNLDPDNYGTPVVTSSVDFVGAAVLVLVASLLGVV